MATHLNEDYLNDNMEPKDIPHSPPRGDQKKRGKASTPTSRDSIEPESEEKRVRGSPGEISNSGEGIYIDEDMTEEDNVRKKLSFEGIQEDDKEEEKDETMEDAGDNPVEVPLPLSDDEEETEKANDDKKKDNLQETNETHMEVDETEPTILKRS